MGASAVLEKAVHLVDQQQGPGFAGLGKGPGDVALGAAHVHVEDVRGPLDHQRQAEVFRQPAAEGGLARAGRAVETEPPSLRPGEPVGHGEQVGVGIDERRIVDRWQLLLHGLVVQPVPLGLQGTPDQEGDRLRQAIRRQFLANARHHGQRPAEHGRRQMLACGQVQQGLGRQGVRPADLANDLFALRFGRHGQFDDHVEAADEGVVQSVHGIGDPDGRDGVFLQHPVHPGLVVHARIVAGRTPAAEDVLDLIETDQRALADQKALGRAEGPQPPGAADRVAVLVLARYLEQFAGHLPGEEAGQLAFARPGRTVEQDVDPPAERGQGAAEKGKQEIRGRFDMAEIRQFQGCRPTRQDDVAQHEQRVAVRIAQVAGQVAREQVELVLETVVAHRVDGKQAGNGQQSAAGKGLAYLLFRQVEQDAQHPGHLVGRQLVQVVAGRVENALGVEENGQFEDAAVHRRKADQAGEPGDVGGQLARPPGAGPGTFARPVLLTQADAHGLVTDRRRGFVEPFGRADVVGPLVRPVFLVADERLLAAQGHQQAKHPEPDQVGLRVTQSLGGLVRFVRGSHARPPW